jgi:hypothetical protein
MSEPTASPLRDPAVHAVIERIRSVGRGCGAAIVINDNAEDDYLAYVRDPANGFLGMSLPLKGSTEMSVRL